MVKYPFVIAKSTERHKGRPALVISDDKVERRYKDVVLAAITSQIPAKIMVLELIIEPVESTGLVKKSLLRLDFVMTIPEELISRKIGVLPENVEMEVDGRIKRTFGVKTNSRQ